MASSDESDDLNLDVGKSLKNDILTCQLCFEVYESPKVLSCQHSFCQHCLQRWVDASHGRLVCPCCRKNVVLPPEGVKGLPSNPTIRNLLDHLERPKTNLQSGSLQCETCDGVAKKRCVDCEQYMCGRCGSVHRKGKITKLHRVMSIRDFEAAKVANPMLEKCNVYCDKHPDSPVEVYCKTCDKVTCVKCALSLHPNPDHHYISVEDATVEAKTRLIQRIRQLKSERETFIAAQRDIQAELHGLEQRYKSGDAVIDKHANKLMQNVMRMQKDAKENHKRAFSLKESVLQKQLNMLISMEQSVSNAQELAELQVEKASPAQFLVLTDDIHRSIDDILSTKVNMYPEENSHLDFEITGSSEVEKFGEAKTTAAIGFQTKISGIQRNVKVGQKLTVKMQTKDRDDNPTTVDAENITALLHSPIGDVIVLLSIERSTMTFTTTEEGMYVLDVKVCCQPVTGSPFFINCTSQCGRKYDRESLLKLQFKPLSLVKPKGLSVAFNAISVKTLFERTKDVLKDITKLTLLTKSKDLINLPLHTEEGLKGVVNIIYEKATYGDNTKEMGVYAEICTYMCAVSVPTSKDIGKKIKFSDVLENKITHEFDVLKDENHVAVNVRYAERYFEFLNELLTRKEMPKRLHSSMEKILKMKARYIEASGDRRMDLLSFDLEDLDLDERYQGTTDKEMSMSNIQYHLERLLIREKRINDEVIDWIENTVSAEQQKKNAFIRILMSAVCQSAVDGTGSASRCNMGEMKKRAPLLRKYLINDIILELQALYSLQALNFKLGSPPSLLRIFFDKLYDEDVISEETFFAWESSSDPNEQQGKGVALRAVEAFLTWIREADEWSD